MVVVDETLHATTLEQVLGDDLIHVIYGDAAIERAIRIDDDDGAKLAQAKAARPHELDLVLKVVLLDPRLESVLDLLAARRSTTGTATDKDL